MQQLLPEEFTAVTPLVKGRSADSTKLQKAFESVVTATAELNALLAESREDARGVNHPLNSQEWQTSLEKLRSENVGFNSHLFLLPEGMSPTNPSLSQCRLLRERVTSIGCRTDGLHETQDLPPSHPRRRKALQLFEEQRQYASGLLNYDTIPCECRLNYQRSVSRPSATSERATVLFKRHCG
ncbi:MAG: hypothetical protein KVP17_000366 [Porospora cf. gigantea B]|uniref:uncharacterized protein n=1 Tax=Porospora cf. gigantea B TaxID=2853592 RepID=UPI003571D2FE|nr:MAG: hypothetical protein KVP17_000366 [Porospora cf. gigantea B]